MAAHTRRFGRLSRQGSRTLAGQARRMIDSAAMGAAWLIRVALTAACAALVAGCGGDDGDEGTAREAAQDYVQARNDGDAGRVCELYSDQLIEKLGASDCQSFVKE